MSRTLKTVIICMCIGLAVIAAGLFGLYRYFVTPDRILQLALLKAGEGIEDSFNILLENEKELFSDISEDGSKTELYFTTENIPLLDGKKFSVTGNSDNVCSVTEIDAGDFTLTAYKDKERMLVNTSLFGGGFEIPAAEFAREWNDSIFKDIIEISPQYSGKNALSDFAKGKFDFATYQHPISVILNDITGKNPIEKKDKSAVMIGSKAKKADAYAVTVTKEDAERFLIAVPADYAISCGAEKSPERAAQIQEYFKSLADDYEITVKIYNKEIRELEIKNSGGETKTIAFKGEKNPFDIIEIYKNGDNKNSIRRVHTEPGGSVCEKIYVSGREAFSLENNISDVKLRFDNDIVNIGLNIYGKNVTEDSIYFSDIQLTVNETFKLSGECLLSKYYDRDFSFEKTGQYINVLDISQEEWDIVFDSLFG